MRDMSDFQIFCSVDKELLVSPIDKDKYERDLPDKNSKFYGSHNEANIH